MMDLFSFEKDFYDRMKQLFNIPCDSYELKLWEDGKLIYDSTKDNKQLKPNNNVPKNIKGDYDLSIHGNKIVLVDNKDGTTVEAKCHPDDNFDIGDGIKEAFKKLNEKREEIRKAKEEEDKKIKVGDWVEVTNWMKGYSTYGSWLYNKVEFCYVRMFDYKNPGCNGLKGQVIAVGKHGENDRNLVGFCTTDNKVYIVEDIGLKKVGKPNQ